MIPLIVYYLYAAKIFLNKNSIAEAVLMLEEMLWCIKCPSNKRLRDHYSAIITIPQV